MQERIQELRTVVAKDSLLDRDGRMRELERLATDPTVAVTHRLRAIDMLNRMFGDYDALRAVASAPTAPSSSDEMSGARMDYFIATARTPPDSMSDEEVAAELREHGLSTFFHDRGMS